MFKTYYIFKKELKTLFLSPLAYVVTAVFMALTSFFVVSNMQTAEMRGAFSLIATLFIFVMPFLTMRVFSEEFSAGTDEMLMTSPLRLTQIVIGKYLAVLALILAILAISLEYVAVIALYGDPDWGPIGAGYLGLFMLGAAFAAFGVYASSLSKHQMVAALAAFGGALFLIAIEILGFVFRSGLFQNLLSTLKVSNVDAVTDVIIKALESVGILSHYMDFDKGIIDTTHIIYYAGFIFLFLFMTVRKLESRRW